MRLVLILGLLALPSCVGILTDGTETHVVTPVGVFTDSPGAPPP